MSDSTHKGPDVSKVPHVGGARPSAPPPPRADAPQRAAAPRPATPAKPSEQQFRQSLDGLSRSLGARAAQHPDPVAEAAARRAIVQAQIRAEDRRLKLVLGIAGAAAAAICLAAAIVFIAAPFGPRAAAPAVEAKAQPLGLEPLPSSPPVPSSPVPSSSVQTQPAQTPPVQTAVAEPAPPPPASPSAEPSPPPLARDDIKEIQARLAASGFNAGPADGNFGRQTESAIANYQQKRGLAQTGKPDRALLDQLRHEPAPPAVRRPPPQQAQPQPQPRNAATAPQRRNDGLDFVRDADARLSRWFQSLSN